MSSKEEDMKREVREAYYEKDRKRSRPSTRMYAAMLIIAVLIGVLYIMAYTPQGASILQQAGMKVSAPTNAAEANNVANDFSKSLDETSSAINDLSTSLGV